MVLRVHVIAQAGMLGRVVLVCARLEVGWTVKRRTRGTRGLSMADGRSACGEEPGQDQDLSRSAFPWAASRMEKPGEGKEQGRETTHRRVAERCAWALCKELIRPFTRVSLPSNDFEPPARVSATRPSYRGQQQRSRVGRVQEPDAPVPPRPDQRPLSRSKSYRMASCGNFGISTAGTSGCACPVGWGGANCTSLTCANPILASRPVFDSSLSGSAGSLGCGNQCDGGFGGPLCNVCQTTDACRAAVGSSGSSTATATGAAATGLGSGLGGGTGSAASDVTCDTGRWTWTAGFLSCSVVVSCSCGAPATRSLTIAQNPTLQSVFSGATTLTIQKTVHPELSLSTPFGANGTTQVQLLCAFPLQGGLPCSS